MIKSCYLVPGSKLQCKNWRLEEFLYTKRIRFPSKYNCEFYLSEKSSRKGCAIIIIFREKRWTAYKSMYDE